MSKIHEDIILNQSISLFIYLFIFIIFFFASEIVIGWQNKKGKTVLLCFLHNGEILNCQMKAS